MPNEPSGCRVLLAGGNYLTRKGLASIITALRPRSILVEDVSFMEGRKRLGSAAFTMAIFATDLESHITPPDLQLCRHEHPELVIAVIARNDKPTVILDHLAAGVNGYILGNSDGAEIEGAIRTLLRGAIYVPPSLVRSNTLVLGSIPIRSERRALTPRQLEVLNLLLSGSSNKKIANDLNLSPHTVKIHVGAVLRYFSVDRRTDLHDAFAEGMNTRVEVAGRSSVSKTFGTDHDAWMIRDAEIAHP